VEKYNSVEQAFDALLAKADQMAETVAAEALKYTAFDVRSAAIRSIKSGGKNKRSKNWRFSKPGEPPLSHLGTLKNAIRYEKTDSGYIIGPERVGGSKALKVLEYGGEGEFRETSYAAEYIQKRRRRKKAKSFESRGWRCSRHGTVRASRPATARRYFIYSKELGKGVYINSYQYFYSKEEWIAASKSPTFQAWARRQKMATRSTVSVAARPYMRPALAAQTTEAKNAARLTRAAKAVGSRLMR
jgi:hypothetical protein